jgi:hypothetical protein
MILPGLMEALRQVKQVKQGLPVYTGIDVSREGKKYIFGRKGGGGGTSLLK